MTPLRVLLVGEEAAAAEAFHLVRCAGHHLVAVLTGGRSTTPGGGTGLAGLASAAGVPLWSPDLVRRAAFADQVRGAGVDLLLNVHSLRRVAEPVVQAPRIGSFNLHPGPLPEYAGLNAPSWAIYHGEVSHAVTLHWMAAGIDTGAVAYETRFEIDPDDTGLSLSVKCAGHGLPLIARLLDDAASGRGVPRVPQDLSRRRYYGARPPQEGRLRWDVTASEVVDFVHACQYAPFPSPWGYPLARLGARELRVLGAHLTFEPCDAPPGSWRPGPAGAVEVATLDEWVLVDRVEVDGVEEWAQGALGGESPGVRP